ncbi:hypothetical protein MMC10_004045 [Thelotrema lepadinum]|nr:hypothetical protein [Thelotrema lepadinum]
MFALIKKSSLRLLVTFVAATLVVETLDQNNLLKQVEYARVLHKFLCIAFIGNLMWIAADIAKLFFVLAYLFFLGFAQFELCSLLGSTQMDSDPSGKILVERVMQKFYPEIIERMYKESS